MTDIQTPAQVEAYVETLGLELAIEFLLEFGGAELYLAKRPKSGSRLVQLLGWEKAVALAMISERLPARVPLAKPWTAAVLKRKGLSVSEIARKLHASDTAVRKWLKACPGHSPPHLNQLQLPLM